MAAVARKLPSQNPGVRLRQATISPEKASL